MILIINAGRDSSIDEICKWLMHWGKDFVRINESNLITNVKIDLLEGKSHFELNNSTIIEFDSITAVFYKNGDFGYRLDTESKVSSFHKDFQFQEWKVLKHFLKDLLESRSIKIIGNLLDFDVNKLEVLRLANDLKINIPKTYVVSEKEELMKLLKSNKEGWITKSLGEMKPRYVKNELYLNYTREIAFVDDEITDNFIPSLIQQKIDKKYEIRTFFINDKFWSLAIFSQESNESEIDSRITEPNNLNHSVPFDLPKKLEIKIQRLARKLRLNSGSIDWIYSRSNQFYFLEINPLGIFNNVSVYGNYQIEKYIAKML